MFKADLKEIYPLNIEQEIKEVGERFIYESGLVAKGASLKQSMFNERMRRMLLGIGTEFVLRATFIHEGFVIHEVKENRKGVNKAALRRMTVTMKTMIDSVEELFPSISHGELTKLRDGLNAARFLRNDCIHYGFEEAMPGSVEAVLQALLYLYKCFWPDQVQGGALVFRWV